MLEPPLICCGPSHWHTREFLRVVWLEYHLIRIVLNIGGMARDLRETPFHVGRDDKRQ
jgi:hypothetical protein